MSLVISREVHVCFLNMSCVAFVTLKSLFIPYVPDAVFLACR